MGQVQVVTPIRLETRVREMEDFLRQASLIEPASTQPEEILERVMIDFRARQVTVERDGVRRSL